MSWRQGFIKIFSHLVSVNAYSRSHQARQFCRAKKKSRMVVRIVESSFQPGTSAVELIDLPVGDLGRLDQATGELLTHWVDINAARLLGVLGVRIHYMDIEEESGSRSRR